MKYKVTRKQLISHNCFICGEENEAGLKMSFYETENNEVVGFFKGGSHHVSYPDRMHGGVIASILDETVGRAIELIYPGFLGFTLELTVKYRKPVPVGVPLICVGRITKKGSRTYCGTGEIRNDSGEILATASGTYFKLDTVQIREQNAAFLADEMFPSEKSEEKDYIDY